MPGLGANPERSQLPIKVAPKKAPAAADENDEGFEKDDVWDEAR
jgi:hypothetical protein